MFFLGSSLVTFSSSSSGALIHLSQSLKDNTELKELATDRSSEDLALFVVTVNI
jgi:hypothetical protein